jgi:hypothetical protein
VWAPPFPHWLEQPGFWDEALLYQYEIRPPFTLGFVVDGAIVTPRCTRRRWVPGLLTLDHRLGALRAVETRAVADGALESAWSVTNPTRRGVMLDVIAWTAADGPAVREDPVARDGGLAYRVAVVDRHGHRAAVAATLALTPRARSHAAVRAEASTTALPPRFALTPFADRWQASGRLDGRLALAGLSDRGHVFLGVARRVRVPARGTARCAARLSLDLVSPSRPPRPSRPSRPSRPCFSAPAQWSRYFAALPTFRCSDPFLERQWWYRWYGLKLHGLRPGAPNYAFPAVCEGIAYFHVPITYSAPCHMRELRWQGDAAWAHGVLRTFLAHQQADGSFHGRIYADHLAGTDFYHADWGGALLALDAVHPDPAFLSEVYPGLARYGRWLAETRDPRGTGMIDVRNHYETGQEYMSRYEAVAPGADARGWTSGAPLQGVDVTVYAYRLFGALAHLAASCAPADVARWQRLAERTAAALLGPMWDPERGLFSDVDPATGRRTGVRAAVCFYPFLTDLVRAEHVAGFGRLLFDRRAFWTPYPVPSSALDDPRFDANGEWKGKRHNCPWNGRVWPMTTSHVADALARVVRAHRPEWAPRLGHLLRRFARMLTFDGDPARPNCFEHYHPFTGRPSVYRGIDDYQHSWINDLIVSHVAGVVPHGASGVTIHPLRLGIVDAVLDGVTVAGHRLRVAIADGRFRVRVDGRHAGGGRVGEPLTVAL